MGARPPLQRAWVPISELDISFGTLTTRRAVPLARIHSIFRRGTTPQSADFVDRPPTAVRRIEH
jgi:hypothetical protein